jgi:mono/diheme cytochrome c family protein
MTRLFSILSFFCAVILAQEATRSVWDGVFTSEQASRGEKLYSAQCASCHGTALTGGESAPPLSGGEFSSNWYGLSIAELFERIKSTMPADRPGKISRQQTADVLSYILSVNQFPAGGGELDTRNEVLKQIRMEAAKSK